MSDVPDHYEVLGVPRDAPTIDIERARKRLALVWHPDRNQDPDAAGHFDEVQKAAEVLRDPIARAAYDREFALRAAMSLPLDVRDRRPAQPPPAPAYTASSGPGSSGPGSSSAGSFRTGSFSTASSGAASSGAASSGTAWPGTAPPGTGRAHARPRRRSRWWPASRKGRLSAGLASLAAVAGIVAALLAGQGHPVSPAPASATTPVRQASGPATAGAAGGTGSGTQTFPLPQYTPGQAVLPVNHSRVLSVGQGITLLSAGGRVLWHETARLSSLDANPASSAGPHVLHSCLVDGNSSGRRYDFISLGSGRQAVVTETQARGPGSMALTSNRVALPDGTIRNPCTAAVLSRAAPRGTFRTAECLTGSVVIGTSRSSQMAWKNGHKLWQRRTSHPVVCDGRGSVLMLNPAAHKISLVDPLTGRDLWTAADPGCPNDCTSSPGSSVQVLGSGGTVLFSDADQVFALAHGNGKLLWYKPSQCALAARVTPSPEVLLGSCPGQSGAATGTAAGTATGTATVTAAATGAVVSTDTVGGNGCGPGRQWAASARQLIVVCPGPSTGQRSYQARLINW
ncbi:MAG TPA: J domain-containing protein [Streptosporangiaceae bacterium]